MRNKSKESDGRGFPLRSKLKLKLNLENIFEIASKRVISLIAALVLISSLGCESPFAAETSCDDVTIPSEMKCIEGGKFIRGSNEPSIDEDSQKSKNDEGPQAEIEISTFLMDTYEVTVKEYDECVAAKGCAYARTNYGRPYSAPNQPKVGLNWFAARSFCVWKGKRLPTEAEWEKAARGTNGDLYPWGNEKPDCSKAIIQENGKKGCGTGVTWPVGSRAVSRYGLYDMAGNSWEWVNDWYSEDYTKCGKACLGKDPKGPCDGKDQCPGFPEKIVKGGSWWWDVEYARASNRRPHFPQNQPYHHFGFRCAKSVE